MQVNIHELKEKDIISYNLVKASWLQKCIRRGMVDRALGIGQLYLNDGQKAGLERKLIVFASEDIGLGNPSALLDIKNLTIQEKIEYLARSPKNRETDRFLLKVRDEYFSMEKTKEVKIFHKMLEISSIWFDNKRDKKILENLKLIFEKLKQIRNDDFTNQLLDECLNQYLFLSKKNAFGARTLLSLAVLFAVRQMSPIEFTIHQYVGKVEDLEIVDDFALDKHTPFGKILNRGIEHWELFGQMVHPERKYPELKY